MKGAGHFASKPLSRRCADTLEHATTSSRNRHSNGLARFRPRPVPWPRLFRSRPSATSWRCGPPVPSPAAASSRCPVAALAGREGRASADVPPPGLLPIELARTRHHLLSENRRILEDGTVPNALNAKPAGSGEFGCLRLLPLPALLTPALFHLPGTASRPPSRAARRREMVPRGRGVLSFQGARLNLLNN
jgi:hypothetical protein